MRKTCLDCVYKLAKEDPRIVFIGSDLSPGLLSGMQKEMPERWYMEGIMEQNVVGMAAGMALEGFIPYANTIATFFTRRSYEQVAIDLCLHNLPVRLISNGGGLVYAPLGPTHLAIEDLATMRALPNMTVVAVCDADEMTRFMDVSVDWPGPIYIRLAKGGDPIVSKAENGFAIGKAIVMRRAGAHRPVVFMTTGVMTTNALKAADALKSDGVDSSVVHFHTVKPLDKSAILEHAKDARLVVTVEEGIAIGGFGSAVTDILVEEMGPAMPRMKRIALPDAFSKNYGVQNDLFDVYGLTPRQIAATVHNTLDQYKLVA
ncbi:transketolase family protein [Methylocapsa sp. S129]|uniref:transketolase family protein n=1 Tax=Methylocapsa sp. S129 TaxID=1641869 RepID=UPI00131C4F0C|nr:transketolase C-terminal domain-containing protein [Methylocapsa sp. S129]